MQVDPVHAEVVEELSSDDVGVKVSVFVEDGSNVLLSMIIEKSNDSTNPSVTGIVVSCIICIVFLVEVVTVFSVVVLSNVYIHNSLRSNHLKCSHANVV